MSKIKVDQIESVDGVADITLNNDLASLTVSGDLTVDTSILHVDSTNNRVGIGGVSPQSILHVTSTSPRITMTDTDTGADHRINADSGAGNLAFDVDYNSETSAPSVVFNLKGSEKIRILNSGGITFNGDTAAANALDDYEEGTWTPTLDGATTSPTSPTSGNGVYTKIGNIVHAYGFISNISVAGGSGNAIITGLPFNCANAISSGSMPGSLYYNNFILAGTNHTHAIVEAPNGNDFLYIRIMYKTDNAATVTPASTNYFVEGTTDFRFQITYKTV